MTVISTKCPTLNRHFAKECIGSTPDLEVLIEISDCPGVGKATQIICPEYDKESKKCQLFDKTCQYAEGFQPL